jgi:hypothetical protein
LPYYTTSVTVNVLEPAILYPNPLILILASLIIMFAVFSVASPSFKSVVLQSVSTTFSDPQSMDMEGHTLYQIAALETTIKPKKAGSTLIINMDIVVCCWFSVVG